MATHMQVTNGVTLFCRLLKESQSQVHAVAQDCVAKLKAGDIESAIELISKTETDITSAIAEVLYKVDLMKQVKTPQDKSLDESVHSLEITCKNLSGLLDILDERISAIEMVMLGQKKSLKDWYADMYEGGQEDNYD